MKKSITDITTQNTPIVCLTAYTAPMTAATDAHCDLLLVGDSVSMVLYGENSTQKADMEMMIRHGRAVANTAKQAAVIVDMPYGSYESNKIDALTNAQTIMDATNCDGVKLEGGEAQAETIKFLVDNDIPVMAHIGLLPQSVSDVSGYRVQGRKDEGAAQLKKDALAVQAAGAFSVVIEAVPEPLAVHITDLLTIPTIGIGASSACNGQILVSEDMLGLSLGRAPKFVKKFADLNQDINSAIEKYAAQVKTRQFPAEEHTYKATKPEALKKAS
jgi:3-methyl-2-oxobutanoate hydroxymethyltransferase